MNNIMKFEGLSVSVIQIDGEPMFELYSTGAALGYVVRGKSGKFYPNKARIDKVCENAEISAGLHGVNTYLTESQLYDFMLEARTDKCRAFRKWVTNEVLPSIRKDGMYVPQTIKREQSIIITNKYNGLTVLTFNEIEAASGIPFYFARDYTIKHGRRGIDYAVLRGMELLEYKSENGIIRDNVNALTVVFKPFIHKIYEHYQYRISFRKPKKIEAKQNPAKAKKSKSSKKLTAPELADYIASMPKAKREKYVGALVLALIESAK